MRIRGIETNYPNLIRIQISHVTAEQMAFSTNSQIKILGWPSLKPYRIVFHRGYKVAELNTVGMNRFIVSNDQAALKMVLKGRMDIAIANRFSGLDTIQELKLNGIKMLTPPIQSDPLYHYLNAKHKSLVPQVSKILGRMKWDGGMNKILSNHNVPKPFQTK
ncbi:MAG: transporter substrate-binding domain-containing protein [Rhodospirillales bacterium]|nr:transporter substrate-binding domain-containing protein [Rhodospirillales bacterium]